MVKFSSSRIEDTHLVVFGGGMTVVNASFGCPGAPMDLLYLFLFLGEGGCGRPREKVALLLAGRTESLRGLMGGGGGWGRDTLGLRFLRLSSIIVYARGFLFEALQGPDEWKKWQIPARCPERSKVGSWKQSASLTVSFWGVGAKSKITFLSTSEDYLFTITSWKD